MKIALAIRDVRDAEVAVAEELGKVGERHSAEHDVFHVSRSLIGVHQANLEALAPFVARYGAAEGGGREKASGLAGRRPEPALLLLHDLRELHLLYAGASVSWLLLEQGAKAVRDAELLQIAESCHAQTLRGMKWALTTLKTSAPQVLAS